MRIEDVSVFQPFLVKAAEGPLRPDEARAALELVLDGAASETELAAFLAAMRARGETIEEIVAAVGALRGRMRAVDLGPDVIDCCGTGGDGAGGYNVSTAAAFIAAGAGLKVAKHGNKAASSLSGSSDVLAALGVNLAAPIERLPRIMDEAGLCFLFAPNHHAAMRHAAPARAALGKGFRTLFNLLGPLSNPAGARLQLMGVFDPQWLEPIARAMAELGTERAWVVHGSDGLDELTVTGPSHVAELRGGAVRRFEVSPENAGLGRSAPEALRGGGPEDNAAALRALLDGAPGAYRDIAVLNAAAMVLLAGRAGDLHEAARACEAAIDEGKARTALNALIEATNAS